MNNLKNIENIINALQKHNDESSIDVLEEIGTNSANDEVRRLTARALVRKNTPKSLSIVIKEQGKGINDLSTTVAMSAINDILSLEDKQEAINMLTDANENHENETIRETAGSVRALVEFC